LQHVAADLSWLPDDGVRLTSSELTAIFAALRAIVEITDDPGDMRMIHVLDITATIIRATERGQGGTL
jgi:hypothetical protein